MIARARALALAAAASLGACTWFDAGPPGRGCRADRDCFRAQGEVCELTTHTCQPSLDGGPVDAPAAIDAPAIDAAIDATITGAAP